MVPWTLVSPANRGIGFALARHLLLHTGAPVLATTRRDGDGVRRELLRGLDADAYGERRQVDEKRLTVVELDVTDETSISAAAAAAKTLFPPSSDEHNHLRLAFVVPGILYPERAPAKIDYEAALETFRINVLGPMMVMKHFSPFLPTKKAGDLEPAQGLPPHAVWATMSARVGSTTDNMLGGWYSYRASKAAVNSFTKTFDLFLKNRAGDKAIAISMHPGTVKTSLSKEYWGNVRKDKLFSAEYAAARLITVAKDLDLGQGRGRCWDWSGKEISP